MVWYGSKVNFKRLSSVSTNESKKYNVKKKKNSLNISKRSIYNLVTFFLYVPSIWNFSIFKIKRKDFFFIYFYSYTYYFFLPLNSFFLSFRYAPVSSVISFFFFYKNSFFCTFFSYFKKFFYTFSRVFFKKLKFKGKGYYIYKNKRNTIAFQFGYSHIKRLFFFYNNVRFLSKTSIIVFGLNNWLISKTSKLIKKTRSINIFTGKGVRFNRQIIYKKTGKVSSYR